MVILGERRSMKVFAMFICVFALFFSSGIRAEDSATAGNIEKGLAEFNAENYEEAIAFFVKARVEQPALSTPAYYLGLVYKQLGAYNEAVRHLLEASELSPPISDLYFELADSYYNLGDLTKAKEWIAKAEKANIIQVKAIFLRGLILLKEGDNKAAIEVFTKVKDIDKSMSQAATFQIALAYSSDRKLTKAREALNAALRLDPSTDIADYAREYDKALAANIEGHKTWRLTTTAAYAYDDNVVLKPSAIIPALDITGEKDNGIAASARIDYLPLTESEWFFYGQYYLSHNEYFENKTHNLTVQNIALMPGYMFRQGTASLPLAFAYVWLHEKEYMRLISARPTLNISLTPSQTVQIALGYAGRKMLQAPLDMEEDRDADIYSGSLGYIRSIAEDKGLLNLRYEYSRDVTKGKNWNNTGNKLNAGLLVPLADKVKFALAFEAFYQDYKHTHTFFYLKRKDRTYTGTGTLLWNMNNSLSLNLQYSHTTADSNIIIYDYDRNIYTVGIEYSF